VVVNHRARRFGRSKYGLSRTFRVVADLVRLRALMRRAVDRAAPAPRLYEVRQILETVQRSESPGTGSLSGGSGVRSMTT
jgi:hypothetical protein